MLTWQKFILFFIRRYNNNNVYSKPDILIISYKYKFKTICFNNIMGSLNPETLYQKVYSDSSLKKDGII